MNKKHITYFYRSYTTYQHPNVYISTAYIGVVNVQYIVEIT